MIHKSLKLQEKYGARTTRLLWQSWSSLMQQSAICLNSYLTKLENAIIMDKIYNASENGSKITRRDFIKTLAVAVRLSSEALHSTGW